MAKYFKNSFYCPDNKDIKDFLEGASVPASTIRGYLRSRGVFASLRDTDGDLIDFVSHFYFCWLRAKQLVDLVDVPEARDRTAVSFVKKSFTPEILIEKIRQIEANRSDKNREAYKVTTQNDEVLLRVAYIDIDASKSRVMQRRERELTITIKIEKDQLALSYTNNERAASIVDGITGLLQEDEKQKGNEVLISGITLSQVKDPLKRCEFFTLLMNGIPGMILRDVERIKVEKQVDDFVTPPVTKEIDKDLESQDETQVEAIATDVKKLLVQGNGLLLSKVYQEYTAQGFFIASATWRCELVSVDGNPHLDIYAGFRLPQEGKGFEYRCLGIYRRDDNGKLSHLRDKLRSIEEKTFTDAIENAAQKVLTKMLSTSGDNTITSKD